MGYIFVTDSMGQASSNVMQSASTAAALCKITRNDCHWTIQVTQCRQF